MRMMKCFVCDAPAKAWTPDPNNPNIELGWCSTEHYQRQTAIWKAGQDAFRPGSTGDDIERLKRLIRGQ